MSGLVIGILLARTFSGLIAEYFGWRSFFVASIVIMLCENTAIAYFHGCFYHSRARDN